MTSCSNPSGVHRGRFICPFDGVCMCEGAVRQCWKWSGSRIAIQPDSAIQSWTRIGLDFEKTLPDQIWIIKLRWPMQSNVFFGYKPNWIKY